MFDALSSFTAESNPARSDERAAKAADQRNDGKVGKRVGSLINGFHIRITVEGP